MPKLLEHDKDGFLLDDRRGKREVVMADWKPKKPVDGKIRIEIPDKDDQLLLFQFFTENFMESSNFIKYYGKNALI
uniref:Uncharacterized protein n=1 Tax=Panagrolaimus sp. JU765 TaxID=591449 RepID=A0AC34Q2F0_9BILA